MGAQSSAQRDGKSQDDATASASASASAGDLSTEVKAHQEGGSVHDSKSLQKNGQISSMTSLNGHSEDNTLAEVGQPDGVSVGQKEEATETMETIQDEVTPQVNGEKVDKEAPDANDISAVEEKAAEEKPDDASEVGFKKIFRFVGFKFTLKKDKSEEKDPVKLLTVKDKEEEEGSGVDEPAKEEEEAAAVEEKSTAEEKEADTNASAAEVNTDTEKAEITEATPEDDVAEATDEAVKEEGAEKEGETTSPPQESAMSPFRKFFSGGLFSNLRKKASIKKPKEDEIKEMATEEEAAKTEETVTAAEEKEAKNAMEEETKEEVSETTVEEKSEPKEEAVITPQETKPEDYPEPEVTAEIPAVTTDEMKQEDQKAEATAEEEEKAPTEVTSEVELLSSQEKAKSQGSPLKKLFTGAGLKKLSTKKQKSKKETEAKLTESGEQAAEQLQSSTESAEAPKADSGPSSPEESGEHVIAVEVTQNESSQETEGEVGSDGEKKKEGIMAWSSFKKLVTPKKRVKRSSESEDETTVEKPAKSATLSSSESAALEDKSVEEAKEDKPSEEEPKTETTEKLLSSTEEPKKKMDTSVSWEALMCMGGPKKRSRKTSDSDDEETKIEEETPATAEGEKEGKTEAATDTEGEPVSSPEPLPSSPERETTWGTLKRMVMPKMKAKAEEKPEEAADQVQSDSDAPKDESAFSLRKFFPGRKKKKADKQSSTDQSSGEEDSETPAVVPLSEYDGQVEVESEPPAEAVLAQNKVSAEDRSPSWIPAGVEDSDKHDQLSDIPEEAENAATPKSVDTDIAEEETEDQATLPKPPGRTGRRLSTAEVKPVDPAPAAATTPVPQRQSENAEEVMEGIEVQISEIPSQTCVAVEDVPLEVAAEKTEPEPQIENAKATTNVILEPHTREEAMAICTGLGTKEIAKVALEKPAQPMVETVAVIRDALSSEVSVEEMHPPTVEADFTEDPVLRAQVQQVETTELERAVENLESDVVNTQVASLGEEPEIEKVGVVNTVPEESEVLQPTTVSENSPKTVLVSPIVATAEAVICTQSVEVSEVTVETKEVEMEMEQFAATEENIPVKEVFQTVAAEMSSDICETTKATLTEETEASIPVVLPSEEAPVIKDTVVLVAPVNVESEEVMDQTSSESKVANVEEIKAQETTEDIAETAEEVPHVSEIEVQSMAIAQTVIQDAVDKVSEDAPEPKKPSTPSATIPTPVQATATTEKEIDVAAEAPVITDTPVPIVCEKPVTKSPQPLNVAIEVMDAISIEVTENLEEVEKKPEEGVKQDTEVKVSEKTAEGEEAGEVKEESQTSEVPKQIEEGQSKDQDAEVKEVPEKVESQSEEAKSEAPSEEKKEKVLEVHMPIQVVLQTAHVIEEPSIEEEAVEEFDNNGPATEDTSAPPKSSGSEKLPVLAEEPQATNSAEDAASSGVTDEAGSQSETEKTSSKCAEVMAQVIEVIEEAVKEIEPASTEITAAS